jgi:hypothetical protein
MIYFSIIYNGRLYTKKWNETPNTHNKIQTSVSYWINFCFSLKKLLKTDSYIMLVFSLIKLAIEKKLVFAKFIGNVLHVAFSHITNNNNKLFSFYYFSPHKMLYIFRDCMASACFNTFTKCWVIHHIQNTKNICNNAYEREKKRRCMCFVYCGKNIHVAHILQIA